MTLEERVMVLAREICWACSVSPISIQPSMEKVADTILPVLRAVEAETREACAKKCEVEAQRLAVEHSFSSEVVYAARACASAIRKWSK